MNAAKEETLFTRIVKREIPADIVYETERVLAFRDINPQAPVHVLVIPKALYQDVTSFQEDDKELLGELMLACSEVARLEGIADDGFRIVANKGGRAGQSVFHIHFHVLGGRDLAWPPG